MEREFIVIGDNPVRVRGKYYAKGEGFLAYPEEVSFFLLTGAVAAASDEPLEATEPKALAVQMARNSMQKGGVDSVFPMQTTSPTSVKAV